MEVDTTYLRCRCSTWQAEDLDQCDSDHRQVARPSHRGHPWQSDQSSLESVSIVDSDLSVYEHLYHELVRGTRARAEDNSGRTATSDFMFVETQQVSQR